ncbi:MAG: aminotransferase class I/II-fold pyridoxal phosphate-dependent enzyme [Clostridiaceae bacterium]|nr:aminotransferase class I/II-fold pyridoxal phosphate-dependent enzyme [Clostridiaceae bacterium]
MLTFENIDKEQLVKRKNELLNIYGEYKSKNLNLDMSRGKPCTEQTDLSNGLFDYTDSFISRDGFDCRNYGLLDGITEAKELFADLFDLSTDQIFVGGNSSLNLMYDLISKAYIFGLNGFEEPWGKQNNIKFLCPAPGYDRHFAITEEFGFEMITIPMNSDGPDMDMVEELVLNDSSIKGMWCIPMYSNPTGYTYSNTVVRRLASMKAKAPDFRIIWDNAYAFHHLYEERDTLLNIIDEAAKAGYPNRVYMFSSTSKITFPGAGIAIMASSKENIAHIKKQIAIQTIGYNKVNMLLHVKFLKNQENIEKLMKKHADIIRPKFDIVNEILDKNLKGKGIANWNLPRGGYFISLNVLNGCAKKTVALAKEVGVTMTPAGATFPYGNDPNDSNIRIAPTYPPVSELRQAMEVLSVCIELAAIDKILS